MWMLVDIVLTALAVLVLVAIICAVLLLIDESILPIIRRWVRRK